MKKQDSTQSIQLYPSCIPVKGYSRCIMIDLFRTRYFFVPFLFYQIFNRSSLVNVSELLKTYNKNTIMEYMCFLKENELAYFDDITSGFSRIPLDWDCPAIISNGIIDVRSINEEHITRVLNSLSFLGCEAIQLFIPIDITLTFLKIFFNQIKNSRVNTVELIVDYGIESRSVELINSKMKTENRLIKTLFFNAQKNESKIISPYSKKIIIYTSENLDLFNDCGNIHPFLFTNNLPFFTESQHHNTCLNRKICIDAEGNIKNCPAMAKSYGNIKDTTLEEAINKPGFKDLWYICKDQIDICKDCEFRYMCTDCRCFIKDPDNIYSQPAKCTYNPYICLWEGQEGYVPVEECGTYSRETGFVPDKKRIAELNKRIWGEE